MYQPDRKTEKEVFYLKMLSVYKIEKEIWVANIGGKSHKYVNSLNTGSKCHECMEIYSQNSFWA